MKRALAFVVAGIGIAAAPLVACDDDNSSGGIDFSFEGGAFSIPSGSSSGSAPAGEGGLTTDGGNDGTAPSDSGADADANDAEPPIVVEGNAWGTMSCVDSKGELPTCIGYSIGHCANESAYGQKCSTLTPPIEGPSECSQDKRSTTYRCLSDWCARGCVPGGSPPDPRWVASYTCVHVDGCN